MPKPGVFGRDGCRARGMNGVIPSNRTGQAAHPIERIDRPRTDVLRGCRATATRSLATETVVPN